MQSVTVEPARLRPVRGSSGRYCGPPRWVGLDTLIGRAPDPMPVDNTPATIRSTTGSLPAAMATGWRCISGADVDGWDPGWDEVSRSSAAFREANAQLLYLGTYCTYLPTDLGKSRVRISCQWRHAASHGQRCGKQAIATAPSSQAPGRRTWASRITKLGVDLCIRTRCCQR